MLSTSITSQTRERGGVCAWDRESLSGGWEIKEMCERRERSWIQRQLCFSTLQFVGLLEGVFECHPVISAAQHRTGGVCIIVPLLRAVQKNLQICEQRLLSTPNALRSPCAYWHLCQTENRSADMLVCELSVTWLISRRNPLPHSHFLHLKGGERSKALAGYL